MTAATGTNLLTDSLFAIRTSDVRTLVTLPGALVALATGAPEFTALQGHQRHAWHAFLTQLAALALLRSNATALPTEESVWKALLLALTDGAHEPWTLLVPDLAKPAFLQAPVPEKSVASWGELATPDELDILVTTKNHDVKRSRIRSPRPEHWVYALVSQQGTQGFSGRGNYGVARMNGGFGSRPCVTTTASLDAGPRFRRDVPMLLEHHAALAPKHSIEKGALALLWLEPWDGEKSLALERLDPLFLEICRRIRLETHDGRVVARKTSTNAARVDAKAALGNTGDAWTPVKIDTSAALTLSGRGFHYTKLHELLFPEDNGWKGAPAQKLRAEDGAQPWLFASAMVRGQGVTEGYHERALPIGRVRKALGSKEGRDRLGARSKQRVTTADVVRTKVLRPALLALLQAGPEKLKLDDDRMDRWSDRFDQRVDEVFFERLFESSELDGEAAQMAWAAELLQSANEVLADAIDATPLPGARRYRAIAAATDTFWRCVNGPKNNLAGLLVRTERNDLALRTREATENA